MNTAKIVIFKNNSPWGVIKHATKGNIYKHIINFIDNNGNFSQALKNEFINDYLLDQKLKAKGKTYLDALNAVSDCPFTIQNELIINFSVNLKQQNSSGQTFNSFDELSNSDICVIKYENIIKFYTLKVIQKSVNRITFEAELDIFFTYNIDNSFFRPNTKNIIDRAHLNRWDGDNKINWNRLLRQETEIDYSPIFETKHRIVWDIHAVQNSVKDRFEKLHWVVVYAKAKTGTTYTRASFAKPLLAYDDRLYYRKIRSGNLYDSGLTWTELNKLFQSSNAKAINNNQISFNKNSLNLPYEIIIIPFFNDHDWSVKYEISGNLYNLDIDYLRSLIADEEQVLSIHILDHPPINLESDDQFISTFIRQDTTNKQLIIKATLNVDETKNYWWKTTDTATKKGYFWLRNVADRGWNNSLLDAKITLKNRNTLPSVISLTDSADPKREVKQYHPQFSNIKIKTWNTEGIDYYYPFLSIGASQLEGEANIKSIYTFQPDIYNVLVWLDQSIKDSIISGDYGTNSQAQELPTSQLDYIKYLRENRNTLQTNRKFANIQKSLGLGGAILGGIGGMLAVGKNLFAGGSAIAGSALAGAGAIMNAERTLESQESKLKDIQNRIPQTTAGNNFLISLLLGNENRNEHYLIENNLLPQHLVKLASYFQTNGYAFKELSPIVNHINDRYFYNYIKATDIFNSIQLKLSPTIKQIISTAFADGVMIWHYRSKQHWKGILSYDRENWETDILKRKGVI